MATYGRKAGGGTGDVESVASANGSITVTGGGGPAVDLAIASRSQTTTLGADSTTLSLGSLLGNTDGNYMIEFDLLASTANTGNVDLLPNGITTGQDVLVIYTAGATANASSAAAWRLETNTLSGGSIRGTVYVEAAAGKPRRMWFTLRGSQGNVFKTGHGLWTDTTTEITSLVFTAQNALGFLAGSKATLTKLGRLP